MKLINYKQVKERKFTTGFIAAMLSLILVFISMKFLMAMIITGLFIDDIEFLRFLTDNIGVKGFSQVVVIASTVFALLFTACIYKAFVYADKEYFSKMKYGIVLKIILWILPFFFIPAIRSDIANFKNANNINQKVKDAVSNNPLYLIEKQDADYDFLGYLVFDENQDPHLILKKLKEGKNKAKFSTDFLSMNINLDLAIDGETFNISNLSISGKIKHSDSNLITMTKENLPPLNSTTIIAQATIPSTNQETSEPVNYKAYIFFYKKKQSKE